MRFLVMGLVVVAGLGCGGDARTELADSTEVTVADTVAEVSRSRAAARAELARRGVAYTGRAFRVAAEYGNLAVVKLFVESGMSVDTWTLLMYAARGGNLEVVEYLVGRGASLTATDKYGYTALHIAAHWGHLSVVKFLVGEGANVNATSNYGWTARDGAAKEGHTAVVEYLDSVGASVSPAAAAYAALDSLGINYMYDAFRYAAGEGNLVVVKLFVEAGMSLETVNPRDRTALHAAAREGHFEIVKFLVGEGADVDATVLHAAAAYGRLEVVTYLVGAGADVTATDKWGDTALHEAAWHGRLEVIKYLVGQGASVNATDDDGETARDVAARRNQTAIVEYLASVGG